MQRAAGSARTIRRGTRFVVPVAGGPGAHPLSRTHSRIKPPAPKAARAAAEREPYAALHRAAHSLIAARSPQVPTRPIIGGAAMRWTSPCRVLGDRRSFHAVPRPR